MPGVVLWAAQNAVLRVMFGFWFCFGVLLWVGFFKLNGSTGLFAWGLGCCWLAEMSESPVGEQCVGTALRAQ